MNSGNDYKQGEKAWRSPQERTAEGSEKEKEKKQREVTKRKTKRKAKRIFSYEEKTKKKVQLHGQQKKAPELEAQAGRSRVSVTGPQFHVRVAAPGDVRI